MKRITRLLSVVSVVVCVVLGGAVWFSGSKQPDTLITKAEYIIEDNSIGSLSRDGLIDIFGKPNSDGYFSNWDDAFWLGRDDNSYGVDSQWLVVNYDIDETVIKARISQD